MGGVIIPKTYVEDIPWPLIFLAGPIRGAPCWQDHAISLILSENKGIVIASPRGDIRDRIKPYILVGDDTYFLRQRAWERHYLDLAGKKHQSGAILFWLPGEIEHTCEKLYGAMTRLELGEWMTNYRHDPSVRFCVGTDGKFSELSTILYDLSLDAPDKKMFSTLEETCSEAVRLALS